MRNMLSTNCSKYHSGSYEPPWDLVYPSLSQLGALRQHHGAGVPYPNMATVPRGDMAGLPHDAMCAHNGASTNPISNHQSPYR